eukprot:scaffold177524_cov30-Tisochrysis_lutea.AAC.3
MENKCVSNQISRLEAFGALCGRLMSVKCPPPMLGALKVDEVSSMGRAAQLPSHTRCSWGGRVSHCRRGPGSVRPPVCCTEPCWQHVWCQSTPTRALAQAWVGWAGWAVSYERALCFLASQL